MPLLEVKGVSKSFEGTPVIERTSFSVEPGDALAFTSPSGSGKSTMLSMAGLLLTPDEGDVLAEGRSVASLGDQELSRLRQRLFGFVFQSTQLVGSLRAIENVTAPAGFAGKLGFDPEQRARELLARFGLADRIHHYPHQLSVGQKRRVALSRALLLSPRIVIADEPTNDLDAESAERVADALFEYAAAGNALLYATHDAALAERATTVMTLHGRTFAPRSAPGAEPGDMPGAPSQTPREAAEIID